MNQLQKSSIRIVVFGLLFFVLYIGISNSSASTITSSVGKIQLDNSVYPIPTESNDLKVSVRIFDSDFNISSDGIDQIAQDVNGEPGVGPVKISVMRGEEVVLGYAGGSSSNNGNLDSKPIAKTSTEKAGIRQIGPIKEISPESGIFEFDFTIKSIDGPESSKCPISETAQFRFDDTVGTSRHCILEGDVLLVEYTDPTDSSGEARTVTTSSKFSVTHLVVPSGSSSDKITVSGVFRIGHPITLLLYDSNLNFDSEKAESYSLDLIEFQSDKVKVTLGPQGGVQNAFDPKPSALRETGDNTGIFYTVIELPRTLKGQTIQVNEKIEFEYTQRGLGASLIARPGTLESQSNYFTSEPSSIPEKQPSPEKSDIEKTCQTGFVQMIKSTSGTKVCVKPETSTKLVQRGWGTLVN